MSFTYPLGLLGLIAVPALIIIYIIQSKYTEQTVTSTYLWTLSEKFLKRRNPFSGITGIISLILQILTVTAISLAIAKPMIILPDAARDYCFVVDTSSSMTAEDGGERRIDRARDEIAEIIDSSREGSRYTLITVDGSTATLFVSVTDKEYAMECLEDLDAGHTASDTADVYSAAQGYFDDNPSAKIYLVTDKIYEAHENMEVIRVGEAAVNAGIFDVEYSFSGGRLRVTASAVAFGGERDAEITLSVDGKEAESITVRATEGEGTPISLEVASQSFSSFTLSMAGGDPYALDDTVVTYNSRSDKTYSTVIVSEDEGFFLHAVIDALVDSEVVIMSPEEYEVNTRSFGLYVFDGCEPEVLPDGAVWLINADESIESSGFGVRGKEELDTPDTLIKSASTSTAVRNLLRGIDGGDIYISDYVKYSGMYLGFHTLFSYDNYPLIFVGTNGLGNRQVVFGFDLHRSDISLSYDFIILARNLLEYSFPDVVTETAFTVGEEVTLNIPAGAKNLKALSPSGREIYLDSATDVTGLELDEVGTYTVSMLVGGREQAHKIYSSADPRESSMLVEEGDVSLSGIPGDERLDGRFDPTTILYIALAVLFILDWGVYCYEKYQLR